jgi:WD40 repeat protein
VGIVGPSGSGKSSLLLAGVLPRLSRRTDRWAVVPPFTPGPHPVRSLAAALCRALAAHGQDVDVTMLEQALGDPRTGRDALVSRIRLLAELTGDDPRVLLPIDQAEELVTRAGSREQATFLGLLDGALTPDSPLWVVSTMRSEFLSTGPDRAGVTEVIDDHVVVVPLSRARLPEVIARPAQRAGLAFAPGLVERMAEETTGGDALPLLAYTLQELAGRAGRDGTITVADYDAVGGVVGGLRRRADQLVGELGRRRLGELVLPTLLRLAAVDDDGRPVRRRVPRSVLSDGEQQVVDAFVDARLVVSSTDTDPTGTDPTGTDAGTGSCTDDRSQVVEVAHEALLRQWAPLAEMIENSRTALRLRAGLDRATADWEHGGRDPSYLLHGTRLAAVDRWARDHPDDLGPRQRAFLEAGRARAEEQLDRARRDNRRLRRLLVGAVVLLVVALVAGAVAVRQGAVARDEAALALGRQLLAQAALVRDTQPDLALLLEVEALHRSGDEGRDEARTALLDALNRSFHVSTQLDGHIGAVRSVAVRRDGSRVATGGQDGTVRLWDPVAGRQLGEPLLASPDDVASVEFSPDGAVLAAASGTDVRLWRVGTGPPEPVPTAPALLSGHTDVVYRVAFSPDGTLLASASGDGTVRLWDVATGAPHGPPLAGHHDAVFDVAFSPDGATLASASWDTTALLWDVAGSAVRATLPHDGSVATLAFSPDGTTLATGGADRAVHLWDVRTGTARHVMGGHTEPVTAVAFTPDGATVGSGSEDDTVRLWDVATGAPRGPALAGHTDAVVDLEFVDGGALAASAADDGMLRLWDVATGAPAGEPMTGHTGWLNDIAATANGLLLVSGGGDGTARTWQVPVTESPVRRMLSGSGGLHALAVGRDTVAAAGDDGRVRVWDGSGDAPARELPGPGERVDTVAVSARGDVAAGGDGGEIRLWPAGTTAGLPIPVPAPVLDLAFSPDGTQLAGACDDATVRVWDVATRALRAEFRGYGGPVTAVAFGAGGLLASGSEDRSVRLSDVATGAAVGPPRVTSGAVLGLAFSADGATLASSGSDGTIRFWDGRTGASRGAPTIGQHSWEYELAFRPDGAVIASAADEGVRLWTVATGAAVGRPLVGRAADGSRPAVAFGADGATMVTLNGGRLWRWDLDEDRLVSSACGIAHRNLTPVERSTYLGTTGGDAATCP